MINNLEIVEVKTKKQIKEFVEFPLNLYKCNPYFIPAMYGDEIKIFSPKNIHLLTWWAADFGLAAIFFIGDL